MHRMISAARQEILSILSEIPSLYFALRLRAFASLR